MSSLHEHQHQARKKHALAGSQYTAGEADSGGAGDPLRVRQTEAGSEGAVASMYDLQLTAKDKGRCSITAEDFSLNKVFEPDSDLLLCRCSATPPQDALTLVLQRRDGRLTALSCYTGAPPPQLSCSGSDSRLPAFMKCPRSVQATNNLPMIDWAGWIIDRDVS